MRYYRIAIGIIALSQMVFIVPLTAQMRFTDVTDSAGIEHQFKVYEGMFGGGVSVFDVNNDGFEDLYLTGGTNDDRLYINHGDGTFSDIYDGSGLERTRKYVTQGVASADVNRDGWSDLLITTITSRDSIKVIPREINLLFLNIGDSTFTDATNEWGLADLYSFSTGVSFGDINRDGYPDVYIGNYFLEYDGPLTEIKDATIVNASRTAGDYLLLNVKGRYFKDVYEEYGLDHKGFGFGGVFTDFDNDNDQDIYVINDFGYKAQPNFLLRNEFPKKAMTYVEDTTKMDLRINAMAAAVGDYDRNGFLDYFITNIRFNFFMTNRGSPLGPFENKARDLGLTIFTISWGANFADFDHDGDLDLYVVNGDLNPNCTPMGNFLFENTGGQFVEKGRASGTNDYGIGRGSVVFDLENDGDMDILFINQEPVKDYPVPSTTRLLRNDSTYGNWLKIALSGTKAESRGIGSKIEVIAGAERMMKEVDGGSSSHLSQNSAVVHFGLGSIGKVDTIVVHWSAGSSQFLMDQDVNRLITVVQEEQKASASPYRLLLFAGAILILIVPFVLRSFLTKS